MKKIICPTDFSPTANNAIEYGAKLAQIMKAKMEILHVQLLSAALPIISGLEAIQSISEITDVLQKMCDEVSHTFNIRCDYSLETTIKTLEKTISEKVEEHNLIVMGTNGKDDEYQHIFGTNSYEVVKKSKSPVLIIPEGVKYRTIKKVVFAWDYSNDNKVSLFQLKNLFKELNPEIIFLHISKEKTPISDDVFRVFKEQIYSYLGEKEDITFERIFADDPETFPRLIDNYMIESRSNLLAITYYDRGLLRNIFHGTVTKSLSEIASYPLLTMHV